ncbi:Nif3-like dinuclear metal center hexameric protein [Vagococcus intermedius]|uniref:GTP cyclohydrolase 1 type 2 homolog n=1 Tax=Vagococcus intermedius TaxID=2991418 RepID=A0AAF0I8H2_9ENTE|nr:Nif3-like dinuclear metal center hexameric protein [Vagococcus intermedius]WEG73951.1 Nif3-like dinuclear metal center hexameric protein [Vagococcus intermedius]WEG76031.1 Nif3-like dinuclear metal center hexameric protein [Vagococcus intermedius]
MSLLVRDFIKRFESYCPQELAEQGDPVGLHFGSLDQEISNVMLTLDVRPETVAEAIEKKVDLIVAKHPPIFRPIKRLTMDDPQNQMYAELIKHDIAVYAAHTNLDIIENGLNDWFCDVLGINETTYLAPTHHIPYYQLKLTAAKSTIEQVLAGISVIKGMEMVTKTVTERPKTLQLTNNQLDFKLDKFSCDKIELQLLVLETDKAKMTHLLQTLSKTEDIIYDWQEAVDQVKTYGIGRVGNLSEPLSLETFVRQIKETFDLDGLRLISDNPTELIQRVAICGGSGEKFYRDALKKQADVYITGDVYYHTAHDMLADGLSVIDPGHHIEVLCQSRLAGICNTWKEAYNWDVVFLQSEADTNPFKYY